MADDAIMTINWTLKQVDATTQYKIQNLKLKGHWTSITFVFYFYSIDDFELNQYQNFQLILPISFHFMMYFVNSIIFRVSHRLLYFVFIDVDLKK